MTFARRGAVGLATLFGGVLAVLLLTALPARAACPERPDEIALPPGESVRLGGHVFAVVTYVVAAHPADLDAEAYLEIDLLPEYVIPETRRPRVGSYIPGLDVDYRLSNGLLPVAQGKLAFRASFSGHTYGVTVPLSSLDEITDTLTLDLAIDRAAPPSDDPCIPWPLRLTTTVDVRRVEPRVTGTFDAPADNLRAALLTNFDPRALESSRDIWGYSDGATHLAIMGKFTGTTFIDVTDPENPVEIGFVQGPNSSWRDIKTYLHYAYIVTEGSGPLQGVQIVDLSDPLNPTLVNTYTATVQTAHNIFIDTGAGVAYAVDTRLRPSGQQGMLVTSFQGFDAYQRERAETWEHLALLRARAIAGDVGPAQALLDDVRRAAVGEGRDPWRYLADLRGRVESERASGTETTL
ncbi:MAG: hypothetical protein R3344_05915, partial [Acidobacteriota bacterium]|nr:hypothetical protein [Acidobacteriota bacterium]